MWAESTPKGRLKESRISSIYTLNFETKSTLSDRAWVNLGSSSIFPRVFLVFGYKIIEKPQNPSDNLDLTSSVHSFKLFTSRFSLPDVDVIYMYLHVAALPWYNICAVLQVDQFRYSITDFNNIHTLKGWNKRQPTHCWCDIYMHLFKFSYRSYRCKCHGHLIPSHIKRVVAEWL